MSGCEVYEPISWYDMMMTHGSTELNIATTVPNAWETVLNSLDCTTTNSLRIGETRRRQYNP